MLLAFHSSPRRKGNLERMVVQIAEETGLEYELIRLADLDIAACNGCVGCARTQRCVHHDDMTPLYPKLEAARGVIMGGVNYNGRVNAQAHLFLERLFPLYHQTPAFRDLPAAVVAVGGEEPQRAADDILEYLRDVYFFQVVGTAIFKSDNPPCLSCGLGAECPVGMPALHWTEAQRSRLAACGLELKRRFEDHRPVIAACRNLGHRLESAVTGA